MLGVALVLLALGDSASVTHAKPAHSLAVVAEYPTALDAAIDVRWAGDDSILIADMHRGVGQATLAAGDQLSISWLPEWSQPTGPGLRPEHLAISGDRIAAGDMAFMLRWHARHGKESGQMTMEYIADLDLSGDQLLVSGLRRDQAGDMGMDGAMAWLGSLSAGETGLKPVLPFKDQNEIRRCAGFGLGAVRFFGDGSFIVVPGTEPGIFLFGHDGHMRRTWPTDVMGIEATCGLSQEQAVMLAGNPVARQQWVNRRPMIDEVISTPDGPAVVIRSRSNGKTTWELVVLNGDATNRFALPFSSSSPLAHLWGDTRGRRTIFLIADRIVSREIVAKSRLILGEWSEH